VYFQRHLFGAAEISKYVVPWTMPSRPPFDGITVVAHAADSPHDAVKIRHLKRNVIEEAVVIETEDQRMMIRIAAYEAKLPGLVRETEAKHTRHESKGRVIVAAIQIDMRQPCRAVG
jgi:hypothetical protein